MSTGNSTERLRDTHLSSEAFLSSLSSLKTKERNRKIETGERGTTKSEKPRFKNKRVVERVNTRIAFWEISSRK